MTFFDEHEEGFSQWAIVELMGHKKVAGKVTKDITFGSPILRIDVPATKSYPEFTQYYGVSAIYCMTPVSEEIARVTANRLGVDPVAVYAPELITKDKFDEVIQDYRDRIAKLQQPALQDGVAVSHIVETWEDPDEDNLDDDEE